MSDPIAIIGWFFVALFFTGWLATKIIRKCWEWAIRFTLWRLKRNVEKLGNQELNEIAQELSEAVHNELREDD